MLMSKAEYAKYKGVSRQTVYDWIEKGEVIMSGKKIDVEATEQRNSPPAQGKDTVSEMWPERTLEMTWGEVWKAVKARDGKIPSPVTDDDIQQRVLYAAGELGWEVHFLDDGVSALRTMKGSITLKNTICEVMPGWQFVCCVANSAMLQVIIPMNWNHGVKPG